MKFKVKHYLVLFAMIVLAVAMIVGNCICADNAQAITNLLCGTGITFDGEEIKQVTAQSDALVQQICEEGIVMLKNEGGENGKGILPLASDNRKLNLFGWSSCDNGFLLTGGGSGAAPIKWDKRETLVSGLKKQGFEVNTSLIEKYAAFCGGRYDYADSDDPVTLIEPGRDFYTDSIINDAKAFSDTAVITLSRWGSENMEIPYYQKKYKAVRDNSRTYLQTSTEEDALIELVTANFDKVIVLLNLSNSMELGFLDNPKIDAVLSVGFCGQSGTNAIGKILKGDVNPSGHAIDTYVKDHKSNPSFANNRKEADNIHYAEGIFIGYKWYETAFADKLKHTVNGVTYDYSSEEGYKNVVKYPFGYGLSYTTFEWNVESVTYVSGEDEQPLENTKITNKSASVRVNVSVTNTGDRSGKEVVQLYACPPYIKGGIEKSALTLVDFAKTSELKPGMSETLTLEFDLYDMASYDCYDKNDNGVTAYELDAGKYSIKLMNNAHEINPCENAETSFTLENGFTYKLDPKTKQIVKNRFTGDAAYGGVPIDGSTAGGTVTYLSRNDFAKTFPVTATAPLTGGAVKTANKFIYSGYDGVTAPEQGKDGNIKIWTREDGSAASRDDLEGTSGNTLKLNEELVLELGKNYNSEQWDALLNQITIPELFNLVESSGYGNDAMISIGKAFNRDYDGPCGLSFPYGSIAPDASWSAYMSQTMLGATFSKQLAFAMGRAVGNEGATTGVSGWYAPGVNLHRSAFNGRFYEYYSEDGVLSGVLASYVIKGSTSANLYCYLKHFALSEMGVNPRSLNVWVTEQALRETYLKPFEIAVKDAEANAMMTAFNHIGGTWAGGNRALNNDILRSEWGFKGVVITDWSRGEDFMLPKQGLRAGNDIWLNPSDTVNNPLDRKDPVNIYLARNSAHNMLYTICNTYYRYKNYDPADGEFVANVGIRNVNKVFAWWIPVLVVVDVLIFGIIIFEIVWTLLKARKLYKSEKGLVGEISEAKTDDA